MIEILSGIDRFDIADGSVVALNYSIDDISDIGSRDTSYSKTITLLGTNNNNRILNFSFLPQKFIDKNLSLIVSDTSLYGHYNMNKSVPVMMYKNNVEIFRGEMKLLQINKVNGVIDYEVSIFGDLGGFFFAMREYGSKGLTVGDLDWQKVQYSGANIKNAVIGDEISWPYIDYGNNNRPDVDIKFTRPAFSLQWILKKTFSKLGFSATGSFFSLPFLEALYIPNNGKDLYVPSNDAISSAFTTATFTGEDTITNIPVTTPVPLVYNGIINNFTQNAGVLTYIGNDTVASIDFNITCDISKPINIVNILGFRLRVLHNGAEIHNVVQPFGNTNTSTLITIGYNAQNLTLLTNDTLEIVITSRNDLLFGADKINVSSINSALLQIKTTETYTAVAVLGDMLNLNFLGQHLKVEDIITDTLKIFNIYVTSKSAKELIFTPYPDYYITERDDWSDKVISTDYIIKPISEVVPSSFSFKWAPDKDYLNEKYKSIYGGTMADLDVLSGFESSNSNIKVEVGFSPTHLYTEAGDSKITSAIFNIESDGTKTSIDSNRRLLFLQKKACPVYQLVDGNTNVVSSTSYMYAGLTDDPFTGQYLANGERLNLGFGTPYEVYYDLPSGSGTNVTTYSIYWSGYLGELFDASNLLVQFKVRLTELDIYALNFAKYKTINGVDYRLNRIIDYDANGTQIATIELTKVVDYIY